MRGGEGQYPAFAAQTRYPAAGSEHCTRLGGAEPACDKPPADMPVTPLLKTVQLTNDLSRDGQGSHFNSAGLNLLTRLL